MRRFFFLSSLRARLILLVLFTVVPALGLFLYSAHERREASAMQARENLLQLARNASDDYRMLIEGTHQLLTVLARLPALRQHDLATCRAIMADLVKTNPHYLALGTLTPNGDVFCRHPPPPEPVNVADFPWFQRVLKTRDFTVGNYQIGRVTKQPVFPFAHPILDKAEKVQAVVYAIVSINWLKHMGPRAHLPRGFTFTLFDVNRVILVQQPGGDEPVGKPLKDAILIQAIQKQPEGVIASSGADGVSRFIGFTSLTGEAEGGVVLAISVPQKTVFSEADRILNRNLFWLGIVSLIALGAAWFGCDRFVLREVNRLINASRKLAGGDLSARTGLSGGTSELARLAHTFDEMAEALQKRQIETRQAEDALQESQQRLRAILVNGPAIIVLKDTNGRYLECNPPFEKLCGLSRERIIGKTDSELFPAGQAAKFKSNDIEVLKAGKPMEFEETTLRPDGPHTSIVSKFPLRDAEGRIYAVGGIVTDITERKRVEESVRQLSSRLLQLQDEEQQRIARELQASAAQTLDALRSQLSVVKDSGIVFDWKTSGALQKSLHLASDAAKEVRNLSYLLYPRLLDEAGLIEAIRWFAGDFTQRTGIKVVMDIPARIARLSLDAERALFRIVQESLTNVHRHSGSQTAEIRIRADSDAVKLEVKDNGTGIPPAILEGSGSGGASASVGIRGMTERMRQLGGRLEIDSGSRGTTVTAILPSSSARPDGQAG